MTSKPPGPLGTCAGCRHSAELPANYAGARVGTSVLQCRRYPPTGADIVFPVGLEDVVSGSLVARWPLVNPDDWCGELERST